MDSSHVLAKYIVNTVYDDLPNDVVEVTKKSILDGTGVVLAATTLGEQGVTEIMELVKDAGGKEESSVIGFGYKVPSWAAAFANGSMTHQLDYEDTYDARLLHPSGAILPAAWAIAERQGNITGKEFITAFAVACDVMCRIALPVDGGIFDYNWFHPPVFGKYGAVTAAGKLLGLDEAQMVNAVGLILHQASLTHEPSFSPGSYMRAIRDGFTGQAGVQSALLAQKGVKGDQNSLEGRFGLYNACYNGHSNSEMVTANLGKVFENVNVSFKPWPCCRGCQVFVDSTLTTVREHDIKPEDVEEITIACGESASHLAEAGEERKAPKSSIDAKISLPFIIGVAISGRDVKLGDFTPDGRSNPVALELAQKVEYRSDKRFDQPGVESGMVEITTKGGTKYSRETTGGIFVCEPDGEAACDMYAYGDYRKPMSKEDLLKKFRDCASYSISRPSHDKLESLIQTLDNLEKVKNMQDVMRLLV